jgi:hypothetical protein
MVEPINLNKARKARNRAAAEKQAAENRVLFGRSKAEKVKAERLADIDSRRHDGKELPKSDEQP